MTAEYSEFYLSLCSDCHPLQISQHIVHKVYQSVDSRQLRLVELTHMWRDAEHAEKTKSKKEVK